MLLYINDSYWSTDFGINSRNVRSPRQMFVKDYPEKDGVLNLFDSLFICVYLHWKMTAFLSRIKSNLKKACLP